MTTPERSLDELRHALGLARHELSELTSQLGMLQRRTHQLSALRGDELGADGCIERLERVLDSERVVGQLRSAVAQGELTETPVPHLSISNLLPHDVYQALLDAIPPAVFFTGEAVHGRELRLPPRLAPASAIVTWTFLTDVVLRALSSMLIARFEKPLAVFTRARFPSLPPVTEWDVEITLSQGRLVLREPAYVGAAAPARPWDFLTTVLCLARLRDDDAFGIWLHAPASQRAEGSSEPESKAVAFRANSAVTFLGSSEAHTYMPIPPTAPEETKRYTYEFGIGPTRAGRRRLAAMTNQPGARR